MRLFTLIFFSLSASFAISQNDFGVWTNADLKIPVTKKLNIGLGVNARFKSNATEVRKTFLSPNISYKVLDFLKLSADYRFANTPETGFFGPTNTHRITLDVDVDLFKFKKERTDSLSPSKFEVSTRIRYSYENELGDLNDVNLRGQLKIDYSFPKDLGLKIYGSAELFYHFNDEIRYTSTTVSTYHRINKMRWRVGMEYALNKRNSIELYYLVEPEFESFDTDYVLGIGYVYELRRLNKGKKNK